jgi:hypothetical protein
VHRAALSADTGVGPSSARCDAHEVRLAHLLGRTPVSAETARVVVREACARDSNWVAQERATRTRPMRGGARPWSARLSVARSAANRQHHGSSRYATDTGVPPKVGSNESRANMTLDETSLIGRHEGPDARGAKSPNHSNVAATSPDSASAERV